MRFKLLFGSRCRVYAHASTGTPGATSFEEQLAGMARQADAAGIVKVLERYADQGRQGIPRSVLHSAEPANEIWEVSKGALRAFLFFDGNEVMIVSTAAIKKGQKADPHEVEAARRLRQRYFAAKQNESLEFVT